MKHEAMCLCVVRLGNHFLGMRILQLIFMDSYLLILIACVHTQLKISFGCYGFVISSLPHPSLPSYLPVLTIESLCHSWDQEHGTESTDLGNSHHAHQSFIPSPPYTPYPSPTKHTPFDHITATPYTSYPTPYSRHPSPVRTIRQSLSPSETRADPAV